MVSETGDVFAFLASHPPFEHLPQQQLRAACEQVVTAYMRSGELLATPPGAQVSGMITLRTGSIELRDAESRLLDRLGSGDYLLPDSMQQQYPGYSATVLEDCLYYELPQPVLESLRQADEQFDAMLSGNHSHLRMASASRTVTESTSFNGSFTDEPVGDYMSKRLVYADVDDTVRQAAGVMSENAISSLLIKSGDELAGILTDRDLRNRVLAKGLQDTQPISQVMTSAPLCISPSSSLSDAQLCMMSEGISHLPVVDETSIQGLISLSDILRARNAEPLPLVHAIHRSETVDQLVQHSREIPALIASMIERDTRPAEIGKILTTFSDAMTRRLLNMAQQQIGAPSVAFCWLAFGSQARQEQVLGSDQDNGLLLDDAASEADLQYFEQLAEFVNDGLDRCGMPYCPGDVMAKNSKWRMRLKDWKACFAQWIEQPSPEALMHASIFFDMRNIHGELSLFDSLQSSVLVKAKANTIFQAMMNENAQQHRPPLGFFKNFVLETDGDHNRTLELKKRGTIPVVDIARNCALSAGISAVNTIERLKQLETQGELSAELSSSLVDAHEFIAGIRLHAQAAEIRQGNKADNRLDPETLSPLVRHQLKDAFNLVREGQQAMTARFGAGAL